MIFFGEVENARLRESRPTNPNATTPTAAIFSAATLMGLVAGDRRDLRNTDQAKKATETAANAHERPTPMFEFSMAMTDLFSMPTDPPSVVIKSTMPWKDRKFANVTTKEGTPTLATKKPVHSPIAAPTRAVKATVARSDQFACSRVASTAATTPAVNPAPRSISPRRRTNDTAIEITMIGAACCSRLPKLRTLRKVSLRARPKASVRTPIPNIAGIGPRSPERSLET